MNSPFFKPEEFACKCTYVDCQDSNQFMDERFLELIFKVRAQLDFPMHVNSAFRCDRYNRDLPGAAKNSYHTKGLAVDIRMTNAFYRYELVEQCIAHGLSVIIYKNFVHIELRFGQPKLTVGAY